MASDDINLLSKLFPKIDKTILIQNLLQSKGKTVDAIHKLLTLSQDKKAETEVSKWEEELNPPEEKKRRNLTPNLTPPPPPKLTQNVPSTENLPKIEPDLKLGLNPSPFRYNHQRYMAAVAASAAAAAASAAVSANHSGVSPTAGTNSHPYPALNPGFPGFLPNSWFRPELAQYLSSTRSFLGHPAGLAQPYLLSRMAGSQQGKLGLNTRNTLSPPPLALPPLHYSGTPFAGSIPVEDKIVKSSSSSITGDLDNSTLSPSHSE